MSGAKPEDQWMDKWFEITRGKHKGARGKVFWAKFVVRTYDHESDEPDYRAWRLGLKDEAGNTFWASQHGVKPCPTPATAAAPAIARGSKVRWHFGGRSGTGEVFWWGPARHGSGMRAGVADDTSGEKLWLDEHQLSALISDGLVQLRGALHGEPSAQGWAQITAIFDAWPPEGTTLEVGLDYAEGHLARWPDDLRVLPERWRQLLLKGQTIEPMRLVRSFDLADIQDYYTQRDKRACFRLARALTGPHTAGMRSLDVSGWEFSPRDFERLLTHPNLQHLTRLRWSGLYPKPPHFRLLASTPNLANLEELDLGEHYLALESLLVVGRATHLPSLRKLMVGTSTVRTNAPELLVDPTLCAPLRRRAAESLTVPRLKALASELGVTITSKMKKAEMVEALVARIGRGDAASGDPASGDPASGDPASGTTGANTTSANTDMEAISADATGTGTGTGTETGADTDAASPLGERDPD